MKPFEQKPLVGQNFIQKLFKIELKENYSIEINNLLSNYDYTEIAITEIERLKEKYKIKNITPKIENNLCLILNLFLNTYAGVQNSKYPTKENAKQFSNFLGVSESKFLEVYTKSAEQKIKNAILKFVSDKKISDDEEKEINNLQKVFDFSDDQISQLLTPILQSILNNHVEQISSDQKISPDEEKGLYDLIKDLRAKFDITEESKQALSRMKKMWSIENDPLEGVEVDIILQKNELCVFSTSTDLYENRKVTTGFNYAGPTARIKIAKGIYYRVGNISGNRQTENVLKLIDSGNLYITTKRVLFYGQLGNKTIRYNQIIDFEVYTDGLKISKATGKDPVFGFDEDQDFAGAYLARIISETQ